jgi:hypothetical protein
MIRHLGEISFVAVRLEYFKPFLVRSLLTLPHDVASSMAARAPSMEDITHADHMRLAATPWIITSVKIRCGFTRWVGAVMSAAAAT